MLRKALRPRMVRPTLVLVALLFLLPIVPASGPANHVGCYWYGWNATALTPMPLTQVKNIMSYSGSPQPAPYPSMGCQAPAGITHPNWSSWAGSCLGVPAGAAIAGAWCGPVVGITTSITCTVATPDPTLPPTAFIIGIDINGDGFVNDLDAGGKAPVVSEAWAATLGSATWSGYPVGGRIIAFPVSAPSFGATTPANILIGCISP